MEKTEIAELKKNLISQFFLIKLMFMLLKNKKIKDLTLIH
jgi:hypothetical protein